MLILMLIYVSELWSCAVLDLEPEVTKPEVLQGSILIDRTSSITFINKNRVIFFAIF